MLRTRKPYVRNTPDPGLYPWCLHDNTPYILRLVNDEWLWFPDCEHA